MPEECLRIKINKGLSWRVCYRAVLIAWGEMVGVSQSAIWLWAGPRPWPRITALRRVISDAGFLWSGSHDHTRPINPVTTVMNLVAGEVAFKVTGRCMSILWECFYLTLKCSEQCAGSRVNKRGNTLDDGLLLGKGLRNSAWQQGLTKVFHCCTESWFPKSFISLLPEIHNTYVRPTIVGIHDYFLFIDSLFY